MSRGRDERNLSGASLAYRLPDATALDEQKTCGCYVQVWLDNIPLFNGRDGDVPNVNSVPVSMIESIEFYSGPAEAPARYSMLNSQCGVLVIHTRRDR